MRRLVPFELTVLTVVTAGCGGGSQPSPSPTPDTSVTVRMIDSQGAEVARATLTPVPLASLSSSTAAAGGTGAATPATTGVRFHVSVEKLLPGTHPFAIHAAGRCDPPRFSTAGPIFNPPGARLVAGAQSLLGAEVGSLPDLPVGSDGSATVDFTSDAVTLERGPVNSLRSPQGTSLVVLDPSGGSRVACGVIGAPEPASPSPSPSGSPRATSAVSVSTATTTVTVTHTTTLAPPSASATPPAPTPAASASVTPPGP
jgi:Cu-Zn family superoxide dismutase